jgi:O-methyltransferase involved in polyketide biosynthesis
VDKIKISFSGVQITALITLYTRWRDSLDRHSLLRDTWSSQVIQHLDFDFGRFRSMNYTRFTVAGRSRMLDEWVKLYLSHHPDAVVLDLGCGLDSRVFRIDPAPGHHWYDVDLPDMIAIRDELYPPRPNHTSIASSVTDPDWLERIPGDQPVIVVADSLLMFLAEDDVRTLLRRILDHFPHGEIVFTTYSSLVKRREVKKGRAPLFEEHDVSLQWTYDDARDVEKFDDRLRFAERRSQVEPALHPRTPLYDRLMCALISASPSAKYAGAILRFRF